MVVYGGDGGVCNFLFCLLFCVCVVSAHSRTSPSPNPQAHKKGIRRATVNTFGYIAKAIGPQEVLDTLLNNLKVQERQNRVCTTVAIAIVAETCSPFTVIPALMNEYRVPELNVQNGVLKALSFLFEYIGEMGKDYVYAIVPLLEDALMDRDLVHRQTACTVVKRNNDDRTLNIEH